MSRARRLLLILAVPLLGLMAACGPDGSGSGKNDAQDGQALALKWIQCMREHGVDMHDPGAQGAGFDPAGTDPQTLQKASEACWQFQGNGGEAKQMSAEDLEKLRQFAKCMRDNGVPDYPDPDSAGAVGGNNANATGGGTTGGAPKSTSQPAAPPTSTDKSADAASAKCSSLLPGQARREP